MTAVLVVLLAAARDTIRHRTDLEAELLALRHQIVVPQRQRSSAAGDVRAGASRYAYAEPFIGSLRRGGLDHVASLRARCASPNSI